MNGIPNAKSYLRWSYGFLLLELVFVVLIGVILDRTLAAVSLTIQRWIVVVALVLPAALGTVMGILALRHRDGPRWLALIGILINGLLAFFYIALVGIAG